MTAVGAEHAGEAAAVLRRAALIEDPYLRADAVWEAIVRVRSAADHLRGRPASRCAEIARYLEEGCEAQGELPCAEPLRAFAHSLECI